MTQSKPAHKQPPRTLKEAIEADDLYKKQRDIEYRKYRKQVEKFQEQQPFSMKITIT